MSIAFSAGEIVYSEIRGDTQAHFLADFLAAATICGWGSTAISGGYMFVIASKQGLSCKVKLWDRGLGANLLHIQFMSFSETYQGFRHAINIVAGWTYLLHMNECQIFMARALEERNYAIQGGIPFVPNYVADLGACSDQVYGRFTPLLIEQIFWSCSGNGGSDNNFRWSHQSGLNWSTLLNAELMNSEIEAGYTGRNKLRISPVTIAYPIPVGFWSDVTQRTRHFALDESQLIGLAFDPLLLWGSPSALDSQAKFRGQIYDAFQPSLDTPLDFRINNLFDTNWVNYMHCTPLIGGGTRFGSLMLALGRPVSTRAEAYIY